MLIADTRFVIMYPHTPIVGVCMNLIAHRGCALKVPENSLAGIRYTASRSIEHIECDISVAADEIAVVFHDDSLARMVGDSRSILACDSAELCQMPLWFEGRVTDEQVPRADAFLALAHQLGLFVHLELKVHDQEVERVVAAAFASIVASQIPMSRLRISSFSIDALRQCHARVPTAKLGVACHHPIEVAYLDFAALSIVSVHANVEAVCSRDLHPLKEQGLEVNLYTVNQPLALQKLDLNLVDGVFSDDPEAFL